MNEKRDKFIKRIPVTFCFLAIYAVIIFTVVGLNKMPFDIPVDDAEYYDANFEWILDNGEMVELPYGTTVKAGEVTSLYTTLPDDLEDNMVVFMRVDQFDVNAYVDDELRLNYSTAQTRPFGNLSPRRYLFLKVDSADSGKNLRLDMTCSVNSSGRISVISYGLRSDIQQKWISDNFSDVIVAVIMMVICLLCMITGIVLSVAYKTFFDVINLTIMGLLASVWIICNSEICQIIIPNSSISIAVDYMMLLLLPFPFLFFMNSTQHFRYNVVYLIFEYIVIINIVGCTTLQVFSILDYSQMFPAIAGVFGCSLIMILITIGIDMIGRKDHSYWIISLGIIAGIFATLVQFVLFLAGVFSFGGKTVAYALLIILVTTIISTFQRVRKAELEKQIAVAQGKAESRFLANMSHEIRTPINAVLGMNEMILRETEEENVREYAQNIATSGKMLLSIVNDILDFSKIRSGSMKIIPVQYSLIKTVGDLKDMIAPRAMAKSLIFSVDIDQNMPNSLYGDDVRVKQIILNLLSNAVKYTEKGNVTLKITGEYVEDDKVLLNITVTDTGKGIKEEDKDALFAAFTRVDEKNNRNIEGTGLGLALVSQLITSMNGTIDVQSTYGLGSSFVVTLPQGYTDKKTVSEAAAEGERFVPKRANRDKALFRAPEAKILVVDDTTVNLMVVKGLLQRTEIDVTTASNGEQCLELLRGNTYDVVLLDHLMPVMDGEETLKHIKEDNLCPDTPIIMLTANAIEGSRERFMEMGFDDYLSKPVSPYDLEDTLMRYISPSKVIKQG